MTIQKQTGMVGHVGHKDMGYGTSNTVIFLRDQACMKASKVLKRLDLKI